MHRTEVALNKLIGAFIRGELRHANSCSCAVGNLCNGNGFWESDLFDPARHGMLVTRYGYFGRDIVLIEAAFEGKLKLGAEFVYQADAMTLDKRNGPDSFHGLIAVQELMDLAQYEA